MTAAEALKLTAQDLLKLGVIDALPEPLRRRPIAARPLPSPPSALRSTPRCSRSSPDGAALVASQAEILEMGAPRL